MKRTKVVATIGPSSASREALEPMILEGMDVARINFSHGSHEDHQKVIETVRAINTDRNTNTAILADLQGPKLRIGEVENNGVQLVTGETITITTREQKGTEKVVSTNYKHFAEDVQPGEAVLLDDGKIKLKVKETDGKEEVICDIVHGGVLSSKKGINLPNTKISLPCLTEKDLKDLDFALEQNVDWIGLSFVRSSDDIRELQAIIQKQQKHARVVAKIEKPEALEDIDAIIEATDAVMVARGDLEWKSQCRMYPHSEVAHRKVHPQCQAGNCSHADDGKHDHEHHAHPC